MSKLQKLFISSFELQLTSISINLNFNQPQLQSTSTLINLNFNQPQLQSNLNFNQPQLNMAVTPKQPNLVTIYTGQEVGVYFFFISFTMSLFNFSNVLMQ